MCGIAAETQDLDDARDIKESKKQHMKVLLLCVGNEVSFPSFEAVGSGSVL